MMLRHLVRAFSQSAGVAENVGTVPKELLMKLRRATGFSFAQCKQALLKTENDLAAAQEHLQTMAKQTGMEKQMKLSGRFAGQGIVGVSLVTPESAVMLELNCETDFVSRSPKFHDLTSDALDVFSNTTTDVREGYVWSTVSEPSDELSDRLAVATGHLGERIVFKRAVRLTVNPAQLHISGYAHPRGSEMAGGKLFGKYATLLTMTHKTASDGPPIEKIGTTLCQQIIGFSPESVGSSMKQEDLEVWKNRKRLHDNLVSQRSERDCKEEDGEEVEDVDAPEHDFSTSTRLLQQPFLFQPSIPVQEYCDNVGVSVVDFCRMRCGEENFVIASSNTV